MLLEVLRRYVERLLDPFANGDAWHDDDVLAPAVSFVQLHDRLDVDVGLSSSGLHLDIEIRCAWRRLAVLELGRQGETLASLHGVEVVQKLCRIEHDLSVSETGIFGR